MSTRRGTRWGHDPKTGLPTIHRHPDAREYQTPDEVKSMIASERRAVGGDYPIQDSCMRCGKLYDLCDGSPHCPACGGPDELCEDE